MHKFALLIPVSSSSTTTSNCFQEQNQDCHILEVNSNYYFNIEEWPHRSFIRRIEAVYSLKYHPDRNISNPSQKKDHDQRKKDTDNQVINKETRKIQDKKSSSLLKQDYFVDLLVGGFLDQNIHVNIQFSRKLILKETFKKLCTSNRHLYPLDPILLSESNHQNSIFNSLICLINNKDSQDESDENLEILSKTAIYFENLQYLAKKVCKSWIRPKLSIFNLNCEKLKLGQQIILSSDNTLHLSIPFYNLNPVGDSSNLLRQNANMVNINNNNSSNQSNHTSTIGHNGIHDYVYILEHIQTIPVAISGKQQNVIIGESYKFGKNLLLPHDQANIFSLDIQDQFGNDTSFATIVDTKGKRLQFLRGPPSLNSSCHQITSEALFDAKIVGEGHHLKLNVHIQFPEKLFNKSITSTSFSSPPVNSSILYIWKLNSKAFVDPYQLESIWGTKKDFAFKVVGHVDLEVPSFSFDAQTHYLVVKQSLDVLKNYTLDIPFHLRYSTPNTQGFQNSTLPYPSVFVYMRGCGWSNHVFDSFPFVMPLFHETQEMPGSSSSFVHQHNFKDLKRSCLLLNESVRDLSQQKHLLSKYKFIPIPISKHSSVIGYHDVTPSNLSFVMPVGYVQDEFWVEWMVKILPILGLLYIWKHLTLLFRFKSKEKGNTRKKQ